jgi:hypothetical protein
MKKTRSQLLLDVICVVGMVLLNGCENNSHQFDSMTWVVEDACIYMNSGDDVQLKIDALAKPHLVARCTDNGALVYATKPDNAWDVESIAVPEFDQVLFSPSLALDNQNRPHIAYFEYLNTCRLIYAVRTDYGWEENVIYESLDPITGTHTAISMDSADRPHIAFLVGGTGDLKYATLLDSGWHVEMIQTAIGYSLSVDIAMDSGNRPHIVYGGWEPIFYHYLYNDGASWIEQECPHGGSYMKIKIDSENNPHICSERWYCYFDGQSWKSYEFSQSVPDSYRIKKSMDLDIYDKPHFSTIEYSEASQLQYITLVNRNGQLEDITADVYPYSSDNSIAVDIFGNPHIAFYTGVSGIKYASGTTNSTNTSGMLP